MKFKREFDFIIFQLLILILQQCSLYCHNQRNYPQKVRFNGYLFNTGLRPYLLRKRKSSNFYISDININNKLSGVKHRKTKSIANYAFGVNSRKFQISKPKLANIKETFNNTIVEETVDPHGVKTRIPGITMGTLTVDIGDYTRQYSSSDCGVSMYFGARIVNGRNAPLGSYPFIVVVLKYGDTWCGGTIINEYWVVSAAHCFMSERDPQLYTIRVGTVDRNKGMVYQVSKIINHERFNFDSMYNSDISLLKIGQSIRMGDYVKPICLPSHLYKDIQSPKLVVLGWGQLSFMEKFNPEILQEVVIPLVSDDVCAYKYMPKGQTVYRSQMCTWSYDKDACQGDSGGPAIEYINGRAHLAGIVSYGNTCADQYPGVYTQVSYFINWIINIMNQY